MAKEYELEIQGQPTRYSNQERYFKMYFAEPEEGAGESTGVFLFIAGYGGHAMSNVYQKMRRELADQYNCITLQCDYLGYRHMQNDHHLTVTEEMLREVLTPREYRMLTRDYEGNKALLEGKILSDYISLQETADDFNEMGLWQAMDNLMALKVLLDVVQENGISICRNRIYVFGQSHGAYLAYLCNFLAPGLFTGIIENSAYLFPYFLHHDREVIKVGSALTLRKIYHYLIADQDIDADSYDLSKLYQVFQNQARIISYHGAADEMIPLQEKQEFLNHIQGVSLHVVTEKEVDGKKFGSAGHSLEANFFLVIEEAMKELEEMPLLCQDLSVLPENIFFQTEKYRYGVHWETGVPILYYTNRQIAQE